MFTKRASNVRGIALLVIVILVLLFVAIAFVLFSLDLLSVRHVFSSIGLHGSKSDEIQVRNKLDHENDLRYKELISSHSDELLHIIERPSELLHTTEQPSELLAQDHLSSQYGSSFITTLLPRLSSPSQPFTVNVRLISSVSATHQGQSDSSIESPHDRGTSTDSVLERSSATHQSDQQLARIVDNFVDILLEENDIMADTITPISSTDASMVSSPTPPTSGFSQQAVPLNEESRAYQRIPFKVKIPYSSRIINLLVPAVGSEVRSLTTVTTPSTESAKSTIPTYNRAYETSPTKEPLLQPAGTTPLVKGPDSETIETVTSSVNSTVALVTGSQTTATTLEPFRAATTPKHISTVASRERFSWTDEAPTGFDNQTLSIFTRTTMHVPIKSERIKSEFGLELPYRSLSHAISTSTTPASLAVEKAQQTNAQLAFSLTQSIVTSTAKTQGSSHLKQQVNARIPFINSQSLLSSRLSETERSAGGVDKELKPSEHIKLEEPPHSENKHVLNATGHHSLLWLQKHRDHSAENKLRLSHSGHHHRNPAEKNQRPTSGATATYSNTRNMSEFVLNRAQHPDWHQSDQSRTSVRTSLVSHHKSATISPLEKDISQRIPWTFLFQPFEDEIDADQHPASETIDSLDGSTSTSNHFVTVQVADPLAIPDLLTEQTSSQPSSSSVPSVVRSPWLNENVLDEEASKINADEHLHPSIGGHSLTVVETASGATKVDPHIITTPIGNKKHPHRHGHQYSHDSPIVVTALLDIGRGKWTKYTRTYAQYMNYLENLLTLNNRMVIFTDRIGAEFVRRKRHVTNTQIFEITMPQIPLYRYRDEMEQILIREQRDWKYDEKVRDKPEAKSADYNILVNSKAYFLYNATQSSKFRKNAIYYVWIDAGYGHGDKRVIPLHCHWKPKFLDGLITVIKLTPEHDKISRYSINDLYRMDWSVVSGGFLAGDATSIYRFYRFYKKTFLDLLDAKKVDDDQVEIYDP